VTLTVRGVPIVYDVKKGGLSVKGHRAPAPLRAGVQRLTVYSDRTAFEVFASDGLTYVPMPVIADKRELGVSLTAEGGSAKVTSLEAHVLRPIWGE
jgi:fructan beta-fructosidase